MKNIFFIVDLLLVGSEYKSTKKVNQENRTSSYFRLIRHNIYNIMSLFAFDMLHKSRTGDPFGVACLDNEFNYGFIRPSAEG